jgi:hypothetical protein
MLNKKKPFIKNYVNFNDNKEKELFVKNFLIEHDLKSNFAQGKIVRYNQEICNFRVATALFLKKKLPFLKKINNLEDQLEDLHNFLPKKFKILEKKSETNLITRIFYETDPFFKKTYNNFVKKILKKFFKNKIYYQITPTIRFQFPNQKTFDWNPSIHSDIMLGHPIEEINIWVPVTDVYYDNSMVIANLKDSLKVMKDCNFNFNEFGEKIQNNKNFFKKIFKKLKPLQMSRDSFLIFDPRRLHATQKNSSQRTRISMDIRIIFRDTYKKISKVYIGTGRRKVRFTPGNFYSSNFI